MQIIRQTGAGTLSATSAYGLVGAKLIAGTSVVITDGASRNVMSLGAVGDFMLNGPIQMTGLITTGTFTDLYLFVE
jgi:hypothetical protein